MPLSDMAGRDELPEMGDERARKIEDQLYSLQRQQLERNHPLPMPSTEFWQEVNNLLNHIETSLNEIVRGEGHSSAAIAASRRQSNVRRAMADLARKRLVTLLHHAVTAELRSSVNGDGSRPLAPLDWTRYDPMEREFYDGLGQLLSRFKRNIGWEDMIQGAGEVSDIPILAVGTKQLDDFVEQAGGLTGQGAPPVELEERYEEEYREPEFDEEELIAQIEAFPEMMEQANQPIPETQAVPGTEEISVWDLAPADSHQTIVIDNLVATDHQAPPTEPPQTTPQDEPTEDVPPTEIPPEPALSAKDEPTTPNVLTRIRILVSQEDEIMTEAGDELKLTQGDVHMLDSEMATYLVDAGVAEVAAL